LIRKQTIKVSEANFDFLFIVPWVRKSECGGDMVPILNFSCRDVVYLYIVLFVYILFKLVEILDFDGLVFKYFFLCYISCFEWYCMMKMVWNWIHTFGIMYGLMFECVLSIDAYVGTEISELHWWSKSHKLRYQVVRSWWGVHAHHDIWDAWLA